MYIEIALIVAGESRSRAQWISTHSLYTCTHTITEIKRDTHIIYTNTYILWQDWVWERKHPSLVPCAAWMPRKSAPREEDTIEKCKHKNKLDVTRSAKRRRREIESFKNEHRKIYLGEKKAMGNTGNERTERERKRDRKKRLRVNKREIFRWTESIRCVTVCLRWNVRTPSLPSFLLLRLQLPVCLDMPTTAAEISIYFVLSLLFSHSAVLSKLLRNNLDLSLLPFILIYSVFFFLFLLLFSVCWLVRWFVHCESDDDFQHRFLLGHEMLWNYHNLTIGNHSITLFLLQSTALYFHWGTNLWI